MLSWQALELFWRQLERGTGKKQVLEGSESDSGGEQHWEAVHPWSAVARGRPHAKRPIRKIYTKRDHKPPIAGKRMSTREDQIIYQGPSKSWPYFFVTIFKIILFWKMTFMLLLTAMFVYFENWDYTKLRCQKLRVAKYVNKVNNFACNMSLHLNFPALLISQKKLLTWEHN